MEQYSFTPSCYASHMGAWAIEPNYIRQAVMMIRTGMWKPEARSVPAVPGTDVPTPREDGTTGIDYYVTSEGVGILPLHGPSMKARSKFGGYSTVDARRSLREMDNDPRVSAIMLHIDSPGGHVFGTQELADEVSAIDKTTPVHAFIEDNGTSAAYWVASQARKITANPMGWVGSLGVMATLVDDSEALSMEGVKVHVVSTGELKGAGAPGAPVTDQLIMMVARLIEGASSEFKRAVSSGRGIPASKIDPLWTGDVWLAPEAKSRGLIDRVESWSAALERVTAPLRAKAARKRLGRS